MTAWKIENMDVLEWCKQYDGPPMHALFCDPPYHLVSTVKRFGPPNSKPPKGGVYRRASKGMMGMTWDGLGESGKGVAFDPETWAALGEHLYPGAFGLAFASPRNQHRMVCAIEDAGFIIQPTIYGLCYLSGFPKATRIDTQIDKAAGVKGATIGTKRAGFGKRNGVTDAEGGIFLNSLPEELKQVPITAPATKLARAWAGHRYGGQALKPMLEPLVCFQKPYDGRPLDSIVATGAGALWIDGGRIAAGTNDDFGRSPYKADGTRSESRSGHSGLNGLHTEATLTPNGRWPGNLYLQHLPGCNGECVLDCPVRLFDEQAGETGHTGAAYDPNTNHAHFAGKWEASHTGEFYGDSGPASRMMFRGDWSYEVAEQLAAAEPLRYEPKSSVREKEAGLDDLPVRMRHRVNSGGLENEPRFAPIEAKNHHPTVKSISVCKYWATLLLPPIEYAPRRILVPFAGVGSEMIGAILAGWEEVIGIEQSAEYCQIAEARLRWWSQWPGWGQTDVDAILAADKGKVDGGQLSLFDEAA